MAQTPTAAVDLAPVKAYLVEHVGKSKAGTEAVLGYAQTYYDMAEETGFDYDALWAAHGPEITTLLADARKACEALLSRPDKTNPLYAPLAAQLPA